jgi:gluconate 2-dehydrogenase gamma chain
MQAMIDRRELLHRTAMILGGVISSGAAAGVLGGCAATPQAGADAPAFFTRAEMATVAAMSERIIPKTDTPGAIDLGVPAFIDRMMTGYYKERPRSILRAGLARADADAQAAHAKPFAALTEAQQVALMTVYDAEAYQMNRANANNPDADQHFFRMMKELTTLGFFTTEYGSTKLLRYAAVPGPYLGDIPASEVGGAWAM